MTRLKVVDFDAYLPRAELEKNIDEPRHSKETFVTRHRRKDGSIYDVEISSNPVDLDGQWVSLVSAEILAIASASKPHANKPNLICNN